jgi:hypothetical protein
MRPGIEMPSIVAELIAPGLGQKPEKTRLFRPQIPDSPAPRRLAA